MTGNRPKGFRPDALDGHMFDKAEFGLKVPFEEEWDYKEAAHLTLQNGHAFLSGSGQIFKDGFVKVDKSKIKEADQSAYIDKGEVKKTKPSATASGYNRSKFRGPGRNGKR